jgi:hypothetical protein
MTDELVAEAAGDASDKARTASLGEVRAWARKKGIEIGQRGHVSDELIRKFNRVHRRKAVSKNPWKGQR